MRSYLDFEKPVAELEAKLDELRALETGDSAAAIREEITRLEAKAAQALKDLYAELTPWQKTQVARHLSGDRKFGDDPRSSAASAASAARVSASSATRRARRPRAVSSTISAWRGRRAIARRSG